MLNIVLPCCTVGAIIILWAVAAATVDNEYLLPTVGDTFSALFSLFGKGEFYAAFFGTLSRSAIAFAVSYVLAFFAAYASYKSKTARCALSPLIIIVRALPTVAVVLLLTVWTNSRIAPVIVTMLVVFPTLYNNIYAALCGIDKSLTEMCAVFKVGRKKTFVKVVFPQVAPEFISAAGAGLTLNLKLMVAAEVLSQTARSMGYLLNTAKVYFEIATMLALVLITVVAGLVLETAFGLIAKKAGKV